MYEPQGDVFTLPRVLTQRERRDQALAYRMILEPEYTASPPPPFEPTVTAMEGFEEPAPEELPPPTEEQPPLPRPVPVDSNRWARRWYCRIQHGFAPVQMAEGASRWMLSWFGGYDRETLSATSSMVLRWVGFFIVCWFTTQWTLHLTTTTPDGYTSPAESIWKHPTEWAHEQFMRVVAITHNRADWAQRTSLLSAVAIMGWMVTLPWGLLPLIIYELHCFQTVHRQHHQWDDFPWNHLRALLSPTAGWIHATKELLIGWFIWPWIWLLTVILPAVLRGPHPDTLRWLRMSVLGGATIHPTDQESGPDWVLRRWPMGVFTLLCMMHSAQALTLSPSWARVGTVAAHVLAWLGWVVMTTKIATSTSDTPTPQN